MSYYPQNKEQPPPAYAPGYQQNHPAAPNPPIHANVPQMVHTVNHTTVHLQQPPIQNQAHYQQPVIVQASPAQIHRFYGCCDAKVGWSIIYGTVLVIKIISLIVSADKFLVDEQINPGPLIETGILTAALISLFIGMSKNISVCLWPIVIYNSLTTVLLSIQFLGCALYVFGAQNFGISVLKFVNYINDVPFMPEPWDVEDEVDWDGEHVVGAIGWIGMLFCGIGYLIGAVVYAILTKGLNDYRKWMANM